MLRIAPDCHPCGWQGTPAGAALFWHQNKPFALYLLYRKPYIPSRQNQYHPDLAEPIPPRIPVEASISIIAKSRSSSQLSRIFSKSSSE